MDREKWQRMPYGEKVDFLNRLEGRLVFLHSLQYRAWGVIHNMGRIYEVSCNMPQAFPDDGTQCAVIFLTVEEIYAVTEVGGFEGKSPYQFMLNILTDGEPE